MQVLKRPGQCGIRRGKHRLSQSPRHPLCSRLPSGSFPARGVSRGTLSNSASSRRSYIRWKLLLRTLLPILHIGRHCWHATLGDTADMQYSRLPESLPVIHYPSWQGSVNHSTDALSPKAWMTCSENPSWSSGRAQGRWESPSADGSPPSPYKLRKWKCGLRLCGRGELVVGLNIATRTGGQPVPRVPASQEHSRILNGHRWAA